VRSARKSDRARVAFLFSGLGSQYVGTSRQLYETHPRFRETLRRCSSLLANELPQSLLDVLFAPGADPSILEQSVFAEPALFAFHFALAELWRDWGIEPTAVMGHGLGEYVAACLAGVFSLEDGLRLVSARARVLPAPMHQTDSAISEPQLAAFRQIVDAIPLSQPRMPLLT
jgi:acyl transferase domain-containing protein